MHVSILLPIECFFSRGSHPWMRPTDVEQSLCLPTKGLNLQHHWTFVMCDLHYPDE
jgi:hypothetical protein